MGRKAEWKGARVKADEQDPPIQQNPFCTSFHDAELPGMSFYYRITRKAFQNSPPLSMVVHGYHPRAWEVEAEGFRV